MYRRTLLRNVTVCSSVILLGSLAGCAQNGDEESTTTQDMDSTTTQDMDSTTTQDMDSTTTQDMDSTTTQDMDDSGTPPSTTGGATVVVSSNEMFGDILTDSEGMTLYLFTKDTASESVCYDGCAQAWPPLTGNDPSAGRDVTAQIGTIERDDGSTQVTVADHPLYYYASDKSPDDTSGQGLNDVWFVVGPDGQKKTAQTKTTTESGGEDEDGAGY